MVEVEKIQLNNKGIINIISGIDWEISSRGGEMQFDFTSCKNGARCKRLRMWMKITNNLIWYKQCKMSVAT